MRILLSLILCFFLSSCTTFISNVYKNMENDEGIFLIGISCPEPGFQLSIFNKDENEIDYSRTGIDINYTITPVLESPYTYLFYILEEGEYELRHLMKRPDFYHMGENSFFVEAGKITYIGDIELDIDEIKNLSDFQILSISAYNNEGKTLQALREEYPRIYEKVFGYYEYQVVELEISKPE